VSLTLAPMVAAAAHAVPSTVRPLPSSSHRPSPALLLLLLLLRLRLVAARRRHSASPSGMEERRE